MNSDIMKKNDIILILSVLFICILIIFGTNLFSKDGNTAVVKINGKVEATYSLAKDGRFVINGGTNVLVIENGKAHIEKADCPDKLCVKQGSISKNGQTLTCLPNKLTVSIRSNESGVDLVG